MSGRSWKFPDDHLLPSWDFSEIFPRFFRDSFEILSRFFRDSFGFRGIAKDSLGFEDALIFLLKVSRRFSDFYKDSLGFFRNERHRKDSLTPPLPPPPTRYTSPPQSGIKRGHSSDDNRSVNWQNEPRRRWESSWNPFGSWIWWWIVNSIEFESDSVDRRASLLQLHLLLGLFNQVINSLLWSARNLSSSPVEEEEEGEEERPPAY